MESLAPRGRKVNVVNYPRDDDDDDDDDRTGKGRMKIDEVPSLARKSRIATHTHIKVCIE